VEIDRIAPTRRPEGRNAGTQRWRELLFLHWEVPVDALRAVVPESLELDLWDGRAYVGVVPFLMRDIAPSWLPNLLAFDFLECNLRTYVLGAAEPGVYFFSLEASSWLAVQAARTGWGLPYHFAKMSHAREGDEARFSTLRKGGDARLEVRYRIGDELGASEPGTLEHFFLERYLLFSEKGGELVRGQVHHAPYPARRADLLEHEESLVEAAGLPPTSGPPAFVHYAEGVDVEVFAPTPIG